MNEAQCNLFEAIVMQTKSQPHEKRIAKAFVGAGVYLI